MKPVRIGIFILIAFTVLAFGAVEEWSQAVLEFGAALMLVYWAIQLYLRDSPQMVVSPLFLPLAAFAFVVLGQLIFHTTASQYHTRIELQLLIAYLILLHLMSQVYQRGSHWRTFIWFLMSLGFFVSLFGILQYLTFDGKLYWFRELHYGGIPFGPYVNRNHFAGFAELVIPLAVVPMALGMVRRQRLPLVGVFAVVPTMALFLSASRGGIISFAVELLILFMLMLIRRIRTKYMLATAVIVLVALLGLSLIGVQRVLDRFVNSKTAEVTAGKRPAMRHDTWRIFLDHSVIGTGLGTLQIVFPPYDSLYDGRVVNHAHNDYLELLAETGVLGGLCCAWFLGVLFLEALKWFRKLQTSFNSAINLAGLLGCCGILVHSLVDFNLHIPANALLFFVAAHLATAKIQTESATMPKGVSRRHRASKQSRIGAEQPV
ncbi:MAG TPA: O-antigen ligase family protein [Candidatus Angelobacter sp.]|jgi:O-antigen ligase